MKDKVVLDAFGFFLVSLGIVFIFALFGQDVFGYPLVAIGIVMFFTGFYLMVQSERISSSTSMKYYLKKKNTKKIYEEHLRFRRTFQDVSSSFDDLLGIILLAMSKDKNMLPIYQNMYKNTRGAERLMKSSTYMLSYLIENKVEEFIKEYKEIIKVKNYVYEKGIQVHTEKQASIWVVDDELTTLFYNAYTKNQEINYNNVKNDISYLVFVILYYQYALNTEQTSLAKDFEEEYNAVMRSN